MSAKQIGPIRKAWYQWKALRLPWRKRFLIGLDLQGNTYWEFTLARGDEASQRPRRIVQYPRSTQLSEVRVPPQWHQWLRYQRPQPPSLQEQRTDIARQQRMKALAAEADARWEAKPSLLDIPGAERGQPVPPLNTSKNQPHERGAAEEVMRQEKEEEPEPETASRPAPKEDPWKRAATGPGETWQPAAWSPTSTRKR
ncbi:hypothetical protein F5Y15DRAFT_389553 [Xylariaceae sp. FL0016]|nr:hypothetical protein F5Y15DRAFT_389553 [Xylariaceae sp. FL0016]